MKQETKTIYAVTDSDNKKYMSGAESEMQKAFSYLAESYEKNNFKVKWLDEKHTQFEIPSLNIKYIFK